MFKALQGDSITLHLINEDNLSQVYNMFQNYPDSDELIDEIAKHYQPEYEDGKRTTYGFYSMLDNELAGLSLLGIHDWPVRKGYTGADTLLHMRGKGVAPRSKPHLFYLAFEMLQLNRVETGCLISNSASKRSIEKTPGFQFEGISRESNINAKGEFEDEYLYAILRSDWLRLYDKSLITVIE
jgi:ribosomal-protein-serine acetyltransferase